MALDVPALMDARAPEEVVAGSDRRPGMRGVLVIDDTARGTDEGGIAFGPASPGEEPGVTGFGVAEVADELVPLRGRRVAVQGCGAVAEHGPVHPLGAVSRELRADAAPVVVESAERGTTTHDAARAVAQDRVPAAMRLKGRAA